MIARLGLLAAGVILAASGCTTPNGDAGDPSVTGSPSVPPPPSNPALTSVPNAATALPPPTARPEITGTVDPGSVAGQAAALSGPAKGTMSLVIDGLGEINSEVTGDCGSTVTVSAPGAATVVVSFGADKSTVRVTDAGLDLRADLLPGDYTVKKSKLAVATKFRPAGGDSPGGRLDLNLTCGS
ncbi:hypothetical protein [Alloactinosynnema sp. L-07]|uniref:hypothetical protein n=1 Tax=Alloactinosynnema sp. L-07 TaxID=1653480 RepID=UPI00065F04C5|nr:hypothetical protein [Alloactinosynnema sp. L-07]CRK60858.1 hypothetical protein [Alloactinosynnema sp. L-07]